MRQVKMMLMLLALALFAAGAVYAQGVQTGAVTTAPAAARQAVQRPGEENHIMMRIHDGSVLAYSNSLYDYARHNEGALNKEIVEEHIQGMDWGIAGAEKHLAKLQKKVGVGNVMEQEELAKIRVHQETAADTLAGLKKEAAETPMNDRAIAQSAEEIHREMKKADDEARTLGVDLQYRNPGATELLQKTVNPK
jgi:hypothetical protein